MWSLAWFDERTTTLFLARDRFGEKPLYLWKQNDGLYFASEIKALAAMVGRWPGVNYDQVSRYLVTGFKSLNKYGDTFNQEIKQLASGSYMTITAGGQTHIRRYWSPCFKENERMTYNQAVEKTREALINAVDLRLRADVPIAFCMSGGVDSNSLISIARQIFNYDVHGFTVVNTDRRYDERRLVAEVVNDQGLTHSAISLDRKDFLKNLSGLIRHHDAPVSTISYFVHWQLIQAVASAGYKVTIGGTGADELFSGYFDHHNLYLAMIRSNDTLYRKSLEAWQKHQLPHVRNPFLKDPEIFQRNIEFREHIYLNKDTFCSWMNEPWQEEFEEVDFGVNLLRNRMLNELFYEIVPVILMEDDLNSMSVSIENRSPFLDRRLFETACSIPTPYLVQKGLAKAVLRDAMRGLVPNVILVNKAKIGFNAPILDLVDLRDDNVRSYLLEQSPIFDLVNREAIEQLIESSELPNSMSKFLFSFLNAKMFLEQDRVVEIPTLYN